MEEELKCSSCSRTYVQPVLLPPCQHVLCLRCAISLTKTYLKDGNEMVEENGASGGSEKGSVHRQQTEKEKINQLEEEEVDGKEKGSNSNDETQENLTESNNKSENNTKINEEDTNETYKKEEILQMRVDTVQSLKILQCPECQKAIQLGQEGAMGLPRYTAMMNLIARARTANLIENSSDLDNGDSAAPQCQLCEETPGRKATIDCQKCRVLYCEECLAAHHPSRGPLASHILCPVVTDQSVDAGQTTLQQFEVCIAHGERPSLYCQSCRWSGCPDCASSHPKEHDLQPLDEVVKTNKTDLSESLQYISIRAKSASSNKSTIKSTQDKVNLHCDLLASEVERQCSELEQAVEEARSRLLEQLQHERDITNKIYREQTTSCTKRLQQTTALVQFSIQAIKEPEPDAFMQMGPQLIGRVSDLDFTWDKELTSTTSRMSPYIDLDLEHKNVLREFNLFNFIKMKSALEGEERIPAAPGAPIFTVEDSLGENHSIFLAWDPHPTSLVHGYVLEMSHGQSQFKEVYRGPEATYTVEDLVFDNIYDFRVKAINISGDSPFSNTISIRTSELAWFSFDQALSHSDCQILQEGAGIGSESSEHRTALATVAFSRGRHFWQFIIDQYNQNNDIAFGVARSTVNKDVILGNDALGWSMHLNQERSWFIHGEAQHGNPHNGRATIHSTVGVVLDMDHGTLQFYLNDEPQGDIAFFNLEGCLHPAVSVNRNVTVILHTSREPPNSDYDSQSDT